MQTNIPSPLEVLINPVSIVVISIYAAFIIWEALFPARVLPKERFWKLRGITSMIIFLYISSYLPIAWSSIIGSHQLIDLTMFDVWEQFVLAFICLELGVYIWHRSMHRSKLLWRVFHQMHHSAERLDTYGAFYFSPMDMIGWTSLKVVCLTLLIGIEPKIITAVLLTTTTLAIFTHLNVKTPRWLGFIIQRPESHSIHHGRNIHNKNFAEFSLLDMLFGTFLNPEGFVKETGFYNGASNRIIEMITFKDVSEPEEERCNKLINV